MMKCKKCGHVMEYTSKPFMATVFGTKGKVKSRFVKCPRCGHRGVERM